MTVVEKIIALCDERHSIFSFGKQYRSEEKAKLEAIGEKLSEIRVSCPTAWKAAGKILNP